ncbi:MAG: serine/threonine-protein phosphatase [Clostridium sp.]|jgi:hypothetical protein|nr:serine/threonine-protein phosphatase [Clostridium sp.]
MKDAEAIRAGRTDKGVAATQLLRGAALQLFACGAGFVLAYGGGFAGLSPFGLALTAAVPFPYCLPAAAGACVGYVLTASSSAEILRFAAAVLAAALLRVLAECFWKTGLPRLLYPAGAAVCSLATGLAVLTVQGFSSSSALRLACESVLAAGACMLFEEALVKLSGGMAGLLALPSGVSGTALLFSAAIMVSALSAFNVYGIAPAVLLAALIITLYAFASGAEGGAIAAVAFSAALLLRGESSSLGVMLCLGGLLAGFLSPLGALFGVGAFCGVCAFTALLNPSTQLFALAGLCVAGSVLFLFIPKALQAVLAQDAVTLPPPETDKRAVLLLSSTAKALKKVRKCVGRVSLSLEELGAKHALGVQDDQGEEIRSRTRALREAVSEQLGGMEEILSELGKTLTAGTPYLRRQSALVRAEAARAGLDCGSAVCTLDDSGQLCLRLCLNKRPAAGFEAADFIARLEAVTGIPLRERGFAERAAEAGGTEFCWEFTRRARLALEIGVAQRARGDARLCGDYYTQFKLPGGETVFLLSDGMGTGGRAAVDSALTCTLFSTLAQAGMGFGCSLRLTNSALMAKSAEESLATLDAAVFDPFTGRLRLYKAGAAASLALVKKELLKLEAASLPAGILRDISFGERELTLAAGDICLLFSDGALPENEEPLRRRLMAADAKSCGRQSGGSAEALARAILSRAIEETPPTEQDDATVAALVVKAL